MKIPFNKPSRFGPELRYIANAVQRSHISGDGHYTRLCQQWIERYVGRGTVLLTPSGTHALELAALLADLEPGDEVLLPTFTFPSTANAFVLRGAIPRFVDIRLDTLNMDERQLESLSSARTRVICPVHYGGIICEMDRILTVAKKHRALVIEDAAHALGACRRNRAGGTFGALNAFSFHETKNVTCGEGGALVVMDRRYLKRAEIIRQKGTNRSAFYRGEVDKYSWVDVGSSYVPSELQAAYLFAQLQHIDDVRDARRRLFETYVQALRPYEQKGRLRLPIIPSACESSYHLFYILLPSEKERNRVMEKLRRKGITAVFHYIPLHLSAMGRRFGYRLGEFPVSERVSRGLLRLPLYNSMTVQEQRYVIGALHDIL